MQESHIPERSFRQRISALKRANEIRTYRAQLKVDVKAGRRSILTILADPPDMTESMKVFDLVISAPKMGRVKTNRVLTQCRISPSKTVGGLSERQRKELIHFLRFRR